MSAFLPVTVILEREGETLVFPRLNTARQLLNKLDLADNDALVIRGDELLTPDRKLAPGDEITVRTVVSRG
ncbi:ubiquitin family protein [Desulfocurvus sp. DL9XJH121]